MSEDSDWREEFNMIMAEYRRREYRRKSPENWVRDNPGYRKGTYFGVKCEEAEILTYADMKQKLGELQVSYEGVEVVPVGQSTGFRDKRNILDILSLQILPTESTEGVIYFAGGLHHNEYAGSSAVHLIAERFLQQYQRENPYVRDLRKNTRLIFIPQFDPDIYGNFEVATSMSRPDFYKEGYSYLHEFVFLSTLNKDHANEILSAQEPNCFSDWPDSDQLYHIVGPAQSFMKWMSEHGLSLGKPVLALDYHETPIDDPSEGYIKDYRYNMVWGGDSSKELAKIALTQVATTYAPDTLPEEIDATLSHGYLMNGCEFSETFDTYMASLGAAGLTLDGQAPPDMSLAEQVERHLLATDRILTRYFLGI
ncbi:M14 family zinc carboxypeptidase [Candidatus Poribacteria bacterium]